MYDCPASDKCDSTHPKIPDVGRLDFELQCTGMQGCKVKISQSMVPMLILRFHIYLESSIPS